MNLFQSFFKMVFQQHDLLIWFSILLPKNRQSQWEDEIKDCGRIFRKAVKRNQHTFFSLHHLNSVSQPPGHDPVPGLKTFLKLWFKKFLIGWVLKWRIELKVIEIRCKQKPTKLCFFSKQTNNTGTVPRDIFLETVIWLDAYNRNFAPKRLKTTGLKY